MEYINQVTIQGIVGRVNIQTFDNATLARLSVMTNSAYQSRNGMAVVETQWHNVVAWQNENMTPVTCISKGDKVKVTGRLTYRKYTANDGTEKTTTEIIADTLSYAKSR